MISLVSQVVERYHAITLLPSCLAQALPSEGSTNIRIGRSKRCILDILHHLRIVLVNPGNPISSNAQPRIPKGTMLLQPHLTCTFEVPHPWFQVKNIYQLENKGSRMTGNCHVRFFEKEIEQKRLTVDCMLVRTNMSITIKGGINNIPQPTIIRCMISILRLFSFSIVLFQHSNACIHQPCEVGNRLA
jgi:hypothetical protein